MTPLGAVLAAALAGLATLVPSGDPSWPAVLGLGLLGGVLVLDDTALAQTWFSQPLPAAVLAGAVLGDPLSGLALGLPIQLIMAVNQHFTSRRATAVHDTGMIVVVTENSVVTGYQTGQRAEIGRIAGWKQTG